MKNKIYYTVVREKNKKTIAFAFLVCVFVSMAFVLLPKNTPDASAAWTYDWSLDDSEREEIESDCIESAQDQWFEGYAADAGAEFTKDSGSDRATSFSQIQNFSSTSGGEDLGEVTNLNQTLAISLNTAVYNSEQTNYNGDTMTSMVTSIDDCVVVDGDGNVVGTVDASSFLGATTTELTANAGEWSSHEQGSEGVQGNVNINFTQPPEDGKTYYIRMSASGKTYVNGEEKGYSTTESSTLSFTYKNETGSDEIDNPPAEQNIEQIRELKDLPTSSKYDLSFSYNVYALVSCDPMVHTITSYNNATNSSLYILDKDKTTAYVEASSTTTVSYGGAHVLYGQNVIDERPTYGTDVNWKNCPDPESKTIPHYFAYTLENGEYQTHEEKTNSKLEAKAERKVYARKIDVTIKGDKDGGTSNNGVSIGPLREYGLESVIDDLANTGAKLLESLGNAVSGWGNIISTCMDNAEISGNNTNIITTVFYVGGCMIKGIFGDLETLSSTMQIITSTITAATEAAGALQLLMSKFVAEAKTFNVEVPPLFIAIYRNAEADLGLNAKMNISIKDSNNIERWNAKAIVPSLSEQLDENNILKGPSRITAEKIIDSNESEDRIYYGPATNRTIKLDEEVNIYRLDYNNNDTQQKCNNMLYLDNLVAQMKTGTLFNKKTDKTGCDKPEFSWDKAYIYPKIEVKNKNLQQYDNINNEYVNISNSTGNTAYAALGPIAQKSASIETPFNPIKTTENKDTQEDLSPIINLGEQVEVMTSYTTGEHLDLNYDRNVPSEKNLQATVGAKIYRPWNYNVRIGKENMTNNGGNAGIVVASEDGIELSTTISNISNSKCKNDTDTTIKVNNISVECEKDGNADQEGVPDRTPSLIVQLYIVSIDGESVTDINFRKDDIINTIQNYDFEGTDNRRMKVEEKSIGPGIDTGESETISFQVNVANNVTTGSHLCYYFAVNHTNSVNDGMYQTSPKENWQRSRIICATVGALPTTQIEGGSVFSNGGIITTKTIRPSNTSKTLGSWVEYGIVSKGKVLGLASGKGLPNETYSYNTKNTTSDHPLTVTNKSSSGKSASGLEQQMKISDLGNVEKINSPISVEKLKTLKGKTDGRYKTISMNEADDNGKYQYRISNEITGGTRVDPGVCTIVYYSGGDMNIEADINSGKNNYPSSCSGNVPQVLVIADGDINIDDTVQNINAWLIAGGTINTCGNHDPEEKINNDNSTHNMNICGKQLTVNGPIFAKSIELDRTYMSNADTMAEKFDIGESTYFWIYEQAAGDSGYKEAYSKSLAPRL